MTVANVGARPILGVDSHKHTHHAVVLSATGVRMAGAQFPATGSGYRQLLEWARGSGDLKIAAVESTGTTAPNPEPTEFIRGRA